jgi:hypothetical protein
LGTFETAKQVLHLVLELVQGPGDLHTIVVERGSLSLEPTKWFAAQVGFLELFCFASYHNPTPMLRLGLSWEEFLILIRLTRRLSSYPVQTVTNKYLLTDSLVKLSQNSESEESNKVYERCSPVSLFLFRLYSSKGRLRKERRSVRDEGKDTKGGGRVERDWSPREKKTYCVLPLGRLLNSCKHARRPFPAHPAPRGTHNVGFSNLWMAKQTFYILAPRRPSQWHRVYWEISKNRYRKTKGAGSWNIIVRHCKDPGIFEKLPNCATLTDQVVCGPGWFL